MVMMLPMMPIQGCFMGNAGYVFKLNNPYEGLTVVDTKGNVTFLSAENERWLNFKIGEDAGIALSSFAPASRLSEVARTGIADNAQIVDLQGKTKITVNLPIKKLVTTTPSLLQDALVSALVDLPDSEQIAMTMALEKLVDLMEASHIQAAPVLAADPIIPEK